MILSPAATGNGAFIVHSQLAKYVPNYRLIPYHPKRTFFPPSLYPLGRSHSPTLVHAPLDYAWFHAQHDVPLVATLHGYALDGGFRQYGSLLQRLHWGTDLRWFSCLAAQRADVLIAVSHFTAELAKQDLDIRKPIQIIYNGVDEQLFRPIKKERSNKIKILFSGNLTRTKGAQWLLPIIQRLDERIVIYYTSGLREASALVDHPRLIPLGRIPHHKMPEIYQEMDILLFPTVREGLSIAVLEAMACGLPVVASDVASLPEQIVHGQGGFLCPPGDVQEFVESIHAVVENVQLMRFMGEFNRERVERQFRLFRMVQDYLVLFGKFSS